MNALLALLLLPTVLFPSPLPGAPAAKPGKPADEVASLIRVDKSDHRLDLIAQGGRVLKTYKVAIGSGGAGPKRFEGDKVTPVGTYHVKGRFKGLFHQFLNVTYPNDEDRARFADLKRRGEVPPGRTVGFGIGIHGVGQRDWNGVHKQSDWTHGCIALDDAEIDELSRLVPDDTTLIITD
ncbi:L,D-transpeptidase family protein [Polyangium sp. 6x1]|uniref:L,D-transpeptidase family protein n=1 Tax=Polyangium sp. 6x1 TaxID=3042689 RepID=UPI0024829FE2|nr:L,D-transpeptidase family protein [Polyangium sp. 6x1]MDI1450117.1 L,D-transpeptidase family protein [Polyangium sp. 6x1]